MLPQTISSTLAPVRFQYRYDGLPEISYHSCLKPQASSRKHLYHTGIIDTKDRPNRDSEFLRRDLREHAERLTQHSSSHEILALADIIIR